LPVQAANSCSISGITVGSTKYGLICKVSFAYVGSYFAKTIFIAAIMIDLR
jgi:hypothetical protein